MSSFQPEVPHQSEHPRHFMYIADPMCSWCYGFAPVISALTNHFKERLSLRVAMGGLRAGNTAPMEPNDKDYIQGAWRRVEQASGQTFDHAFFDRQGFIYDTEPACRAVVTARQTSQAHALEVMGDISKAFYGENRDTTSADVLAKICVPKGVNHQAGAREEFVNLFKSTKMIDETARDFDFAKRSGVEGFPCLLVGNITEGYSLVSHGFRPLDGMPEAIEKWLDQVEDTSRD